VLQPHRELRICLHQEQLIDNEQRNRSTARRTIEEGSTVEAEYIMSGKYVFSQALKEVRFLFCQTGEHSGPTR
jgi:hypothetical protein